jgi:hypothetical protein
MGPGFPRGTCPWAEGSEPHIMLSHCVARRMPMASSWKLKTTRAVLPPGLNSPLIARRSRCLTLPA